MDQSAKDHYFNSNPAPDSIKKHVELVREFISFHTAKHRVVLVTSGGTTVPLEKRTVRFIDNFSAGSRGAKSAEYFLEAGYAVIFLHREFSLTPFSRHWSHSGDGFLDYLSEGSDGSVVVDSQHQEKISSVLRKYNKARKNNMLLVLPFTTITDYLHELRAIAQCMDSIGGDGLLYLAAAVSDFFIPLERMSEHKIQSTDAADGFKNSNRNNNNKPNNKNNNNGAARHAQALAEEEFDNFDSSPSVLRPKRLVLDLDPVPKFLKNLVEDWAPGCMVVSYKLETDPDLLIEKAKMALDRYQHDLVIGNLLTTRKWEVVFVTPGQEEKWIRLPNTEGEHGPPKHMTPNDDELEIESLIVDDVIRLHAEYVKRYERK